MTKAAKRKSGRLGFEPRNSFRVDLKGPPVSESFAVLTKMQIPGVLSHPSRTGTPESGVWERLPGHSRARPSLRITAKGCAHREETTNPPRALMHEMETGFFFFENGEVSLLRSISQRPTYVRPRSPSFE